MPIYKTRFDAMWAGLAAVIKDAAGSVVEGSPITVDSVGGVEIELDEGTYKAYVSDGARPNPRMAVADLFYDIPDSIANTPGAAETAYFVGTATADTSGDAFPVTFVQHPDYDPKDWASAVGGNVEVECPAIISIKARQGGDLDMSEATGFSTETTAPYIEGFIKANPDSKGANNHSYIDYVVPLDTVGDTFDLDVPSNTSTDVTGHTTLVITATSDAMAFDAAGDPVTDGVLNVAMVLELTQETLPPLPPA